MRKMRNWINKKLKFKKGDPELDGGGVDDIVNKNKGLKYLEKRQFFFKVKDQWPYNNGLENFYKRHVFFEMMDKKYAEFENRVNNLALEKNDDDKVDLVKCGVCGKEFSVEMDEIKTEKIVKAPTAVRKNYYSDINGDGFMFSELTEIQWSSELETGKKSKKWDLLGMLRAKWGKVMKIGKN